MNKGNAINDAKSIISALDWYVPHYTPSLEEYDKLMNQIVKKTPTMLSYPEKSVFMKGVKSQTIWNFELGFQEGVIVPIWIYVVFQQNDKGNDQILNNDTFFRLPITSAQVIIGTEKYPVSGILLNYKDDDYTQGYGQIKEAFAALTKDDKLQPYICEDDFRSSNHGDDGNEIGYNIHAFDIRYQKNFESAQPINVEFKFDGVIPDGVFGYALVLTNRLVSIISDGQRMLDLVKFKVFITSLFCFNFN